MSATCLPSDAGRGSTRQASLILLVAVSTLLASCAHRVSVAELPAPAIDPESDIASARTSWNRLRRDRDNPETRDEYNNAVTRVIHHATINDDETGAARSLTVGDRIIPLVDHLNGTSDLANVDRLWPADDMVIRGFRERVTVEGIGAPLVMRFPPEGYAPEEGRFQPATGILRFDGPGGAPQFVVHDTLAESDARLAAGMAPARLRADYTAPLAARFAAEDRQRINLPAMLRPDKFDELLGLVQLDTTYPHKIPVVFVHGLKSSPNTWRDTLNELRADPVIREHFEFWTFGYTTGPPFPYSAMKLREALQGMAIFRRQMGAPTDDVVLVGHSMGGLLSRLMTEKSGDDVWFQFFNEPVDELPLPEEEREIIRNMAYFEPLPFVSRVVFIATPHGGSQMADDAIGRIFSQLIRLPSQLITLSTTVLSESVYALTPFGQAILGERLPTSIDMLEADSELLNRLKADPLNPNVTFHSIIGDKGPEGDREGTDGVVPYASAHLEGVASEKVVQSGHRAHQDPVAIAELDRILREHVRATGAE